MTLRNRLGALVLAWLVLIPVAIAVPAEAAALEVESQPAATETPDTAAIEFGTRVSSSSSHSATMVRASAVRSSFLPTDPMLPRPKFQIWPDDSIKQQVNLDAFLMITSGFRRKTWCICAWFFTAVFRATPLRSSFEFRETGTGKRTTETCWGPGAPWLPGLTDPSSFPFCGKEWEHSSNVTGIVEAKARVQHIVVVTGSVNFVYPAQSRASDTQRLRVGEVQTVGQRVRLAAAPPTTAPPTIEDTASVCDGWGISYLCWAAEAAYNAAVETILRAAPILREVKRFFDGCADAAVDAAGGLVDILTELKDAISNPSEWAQEKLQEFKDLIEAIETDPEGFARDVLGELAMLDVLENEGVAVWLGKVTCMLAIDYFTGKAAASIIGKARTWLRDRNNPNRPDPDRPNRPDDAPCRLSSFAADTLVKMADDTYTRIDEIRPGDQVLSHDFDTSTWEPGLVVEQWSHPDRGPPTTVELSNGSSVTATDHHLFWDAANHEWAQIQHFTTGDQLLTPNGPVQVDNVTQAPAAEWTVWELTVLGNHNFTVRMGEHDVLVHNKLPCDPNLEGDLAAHAPTNKGQHPNIDGLQPHVGTTKPGRNANGTWRGGWREAPNIETWRLRGGEVYPDGNGGLIYQRADGVRVRYNADGYPDFSPHAIAQVEITGRRNHSTDFGDANRAIGKGEWGNDVPEGYTWHHVEREPCCVMQLVPTSVHNARNGFTHRGGVSTNGGD